MNQGDRIEVVPAREPVQTSDVMQILQLLGRNLHTVAWDIMNESMSHERELEFGELLIEAGVVLQAHARNVHRITLDDGEQPQR